MHRRPSRFPHLEPSAVRVAFLALVASVLLASSVAAKASSPYAAILEEAYSANAPGATAIVVKDGEVLYRGARGMADLELKVPLIPEHVFRLGSITKQITAAAVLMLAEEGQLALDDDITKFLPDYPTQGHHVSVEHLLTHTSGIHSYTDIPGYMVSNEIRADLTTDELVDVFAHLPMDFAPGERFKYNNSGYVLLGAIIEKISGQSYADFIEQRIFEPLGMKNSYYGGLQLIPLRVEGYAGPPGQWVNAPFLSMTQPHAAGSLLSTVDDLARWNAALFGGEVLEPESLERMTSKFVLNDGEETSYGYGFLLSELRDEPAIQHGGGIHGFSTHALFLPQSKVYVAVLSNWPENPVRPLYVVQRMAALAIGKPFPQREAISLDAEVLDDYVGVYRIDEETTRTVTLEDGQLYTQRTEGPRFEAVPYEKDAFFYEGSFTHLRFVRDAEGRVTAMRMYSEGSDEAEVAERVAEEVPAAEREIADVSPELYDLWAGTYEIQPGFELEIRREGDRLVSQATGQPAFELHPSSAHRYFVAEFPAELEFEPGDDGRAKAVTLYQGGQEIRAERIE